MPFDFLAGYVMGSRQATRVTALSIAAESFRSRSDAVHDDELEARIDRMVLVLEAMWSLLRETGLTDEQLAAKIAELDQADGAADGRRTLPAHKCRQCEATVGGGIPNCQFCGTPVAADDQGSPFTAL